MLVVEIVLNFGGNIVELSFDYEHIDFQVVSSIINHDAYFTNHFFFFFMKYY